MKERREYERRNEAIAARQSLEQQFEGNEGDGGGCDSGDSGSNGGGGGEGSRGR